MPTEFLAVALLLVSAALVAWHRSTRRKAGERRRFGGLFGPSHLDTLMHCGQCPAAVSCHARFEGECRAGGKARIFCPELPYVLRAIGRENQ